MPKRAPGPHSLFRGKVRQPVSVTLTKRHHAKLKAAMARLNLSRSDTIGLLIECFADAARIPHDLVVDDDD
jgi:antitoxin component of RelBE/YafQ-DinJ toxin-antitoxin module